MPNGIREKRPKGDVATTDSLPRILRHNRLSVCLRSRAYDIICDMHPLYEKANAASADVYEAALEVRKHFGIGLPESLYQKCLARELQLSFVHEADGLAAWAGHQLR